MSSFFTGLAYRPRPSSSAQTMELAAIRPAPQESSDSGALVVHRGDSMDEDTSDNSVVELPIRGRAAAHPARHGAPKTNIKVKKSNGKTKESIKKTVSAAAILKKRKAIARAKKLQAGARKFEMTVNIDAFGENITSIEQFLEDSMAEDFDVIGAEYEATMNSHAAKDFAFVNYIEGTMDLLSTPLAHEHVSVNFTRGGNHVTDVVQMGERMSTYKDYVDTQNNHLTGYWTEWEELQDEYMDLGIEVFGSDAFHHPPAGVKKFEAGFERKMELAHLEHQKKLRDVNKMLEVLETDFIKEIKTIDEEYATAMKNSKASLLKALM